MDNQKLFEAVESLKSSYVPLSRYPSTQRDICFQVTSDTAYAQVISAVEKVLSLSKIDTSITPVDIYQPLGGATKNMTIRIKLTADDHTLTSNEANDLIQEVSQSVIQATGATVI